MWSEPDICRSFLISSSKFFSLFSINQYGFCNFWLIRYSLQI
jgi:hypothetical protein